MGPSRRRSPAPVEDPRPAGRRRDTIALALGSGLSGLLAYVVFALSTRALGAEAAAPVSVLWTYWGFAAAALTFPLQHWITRTVTVQGEGSVRHALPRVSMAVLASSIALGGLCWLGRMPLFHVDGVAWPALVALLTLGSGVIGVVRGRLNASRRYVSIGVSLVAENGLRCIAVGALFVSGVRDPSAYGLSLVAGHLVSVFWLRSVRFGTGVTTTERRRPLTFLTGAGSAQLLGQIVLTGSPVLLALAGGTPAAVTALFATLALFRAPYLLAIGLVAQLSSKISALVVAEETAALQRLRAATLATTAVTVGLAGVFGVWLGPPVLRLIFGATVHFDGMSSGVVAVACTLAVANLVLVISILAHGRPRNAVIGWLGAFVVGGLAFLALGALPPSDRIVWCFLAAEAAAFAILSVGEAHFSRRKH